ncbi:MAG: hypothetical protein ACI90V_011747, partial [Bacillariaceae sp.]
MFLINFIYLIMKREEGKMRCEKERKCKLVCDSL